MLEIADIIAALILVRNLHRDDEAFLILCTGCIIAGPFWVSWSCLLDYVEQSSQTFTAKWFECARPYLFALYMFAPFGMLVVFMLDIYFLIYAFLVDLYYACTCSSLTKNSGSGFENEFSQAYPRFRYFTHVVGHSVPLIIFSVISFSLWNEELNDSTNEAIMVSVAFSLFNILFFILNFSFRLSGKLNVTWSEYVKYCSRLAGGVLPQLGEVRAGLTQTIDWSRTTIERANYAMVVEALSDNKCKLERATLSPYTLQSLAPVLCQQLGEAFGKQKEGQQTENVKVEFVALKYSHLLAKWDHFEKKDNASSSEMKWEEFETGIKELFKYHTQDEIDDVLRFVHKKIQHDDIVYYSDYSALIKHKKFRSLLVVGNPVIYALQDLDRDSLSSNQLFEFMMGYGGLNRADPKTNETALFFALKNQDITLVEKLIGLGARSTDQDWDTISKYIVELMNHKPKPQSETIQRIINFITGYSEIDWDPRPWKDDKANGVVHHLALAGDVDCCRSLFGNDNPFKLEVTDLNNNGETPLDIAH
eukprot:UN25241